MLEINNLDVTVGEKSILNELNLKIGSGEIHAIMGPNGSGKSTLSYVLAGREGYKVNKGKVIFLGQDLLTMTPEERAIAGLFLAFQYPVEIPGVVTMNFLKSSLNAIRKGRGLDELDAVGVLKILKEKSKQLGIADEMLKRSVNVGFSGGEKKRNDILQMSVLDPKLCILDETDSGLDIDALKSVADGINKLRSPNRSMIIITHYQRLLDYVVPDHVHIMAKGRIVCSGGLSLVRELEERGYNKFIPDQVA